MINLLEFSLISLDHCFSGLYFSELAQAYLTKLVGSTLFSWILCCQRV